MVKRIDRDVTTKSLVFQIQCQFTQVQVANDSKTFSKISCLLI